MEYRFREDLENDAEAYEIMYNKVEMELQKKGIPSKVNRRMKTRQGLVSIIPFPVRGNATAYAAINEMPGLVRRMQSRGMVKDGIYLFANAVFSGPAVLKSLGDTITFYQQEEQEPKNESIKEFKIRL